MGWAFWRRSKGSVPQRPLPDDVGLGGAAPPSRPAADRPVDREEHDAVRPPTGSRAVPSTAVPDLPGGPVPLTTPFGAGTDDPAFRDACRDAVVAVVQPVVDGDSPLARRRVDALRALLATATPVQQDQAVAVSHAALSVRLPALSGVSASVQDDAEAEGNGLSLLLAYADLLAARAEPLRERTAPSVPREQLRLAAHLACGAPDADPSLSSLLASPTGDRVVAACLLLAQTCRDGGGPPEAVAAEIDAAGA